jgi:ABC-type branched-subunit amino acid transport system ATPase component
MLVAENVVKHFAGVTALAGVGIEVKAGECVGLLGPNGSGKSTFLNTLSGFERPESGTVTFAGVRIERSKPWEVARLGLRRTFQLPREPERMTVLDVMLTGAHLPLGGTAWASLLLPRRVASEQRSALERARELLSWLTLLPLENDAAASLSGGQQKLLGLGAVLMSTPRMLLLDEPVAGVHQSLRRKLVGALRRVRESGTAIVVVEHDLAFVRELCERAYVLDAGKVIASCPPSELARDPRVVEAYLGSSQGVSDALPSAARHTRGPL